MLLFCTQRTDPCKATPCHHLKGHPDPQNHTLSRDKMLSLPHAHSYAGETNPPPNKFNSPCSFPVTPASTPLARASHMASQGPAESAPPPGIHGNSTDIKYHSGKWRPGVRSSTCLVFQSMPWGQLWAKCPLPSSLSSPLHIP
jgi:hypothetical protein